MMTDPNDGDVRSFDAAETANISKQPTVQENESGTAEGKGSVPSVEKLVAEQQPFYDAKLRRREVYRSRLERFWAAAQGNSLGVDDKAEREIFLRTMVEVSEDLAVLVADEEVAPLLGEVIMGSVQEVELEVADRLSTFSDRSDRARFLRSIAPTIDRLEIAGEGTREQRVDIVTRVLFPLRGSPSAAKLGCELYRYLQAQVERSAGFYQTVTNLAVIVSAERAEYATQAMLMYHSALDGMRNLGNDESRNLVCTAAANLATIISSRVRNMDSNTAVNVSPVLRDLKTISAVTCPIPSFEASDPGVVATGLRLPKIRSGEFLSVFMDMAEVPGAWEFDNIATSRLEAVGGVVAAAAGSTLRGVDLFFNSGISLRSQTGAVEGEDKKILLRARMLINAAGLRLALAAGENLYESLIGFDGIDCAVNFAASFVDYKAAGDDDAALDLEPLAIEIVHLAKWPLLQGAGRRLDLNRLERSAGLLGITVDVRSTFPALGEALPRAIEGLRGSFGLGSGRWDDVVVDTADLVGSLYSSVLAAEDTEKLRSLVAELVAWRPDAMRVLSDTYGPYVSTTPRDVGRGPAVVAGVIAEAEWRNVAGRLMDPVASVVRAIAEFSS